MKDLMNFDDNLAGLFREKPSEYLKIFESAIETIYRVDYYDQGEHGFEPQPKFQL